MATNWMSGFFVPLLKALVLIGFFGTIIAVISYYLARFYKIKLRLWIKYYIFGKDYDKEAVEFSVQCLDKKMNYYDVKKELLLADMSMNDVYDIMFIYKKISKELQGGVDYGRSIKRHYPKSQERERSSPAKSC